MFIHGHRVSSDNTYAAGCNLITFLDSALRNLCRFLMSTALSPRLITETLPSRALLLITRQISCYFEVETLFLSFHFLIWYLYWDSLDTAVDISTPIPRDLSRVLTQLESHNDS